MSSSRIPQPPKAPAFRERAWVEDFIEQLAAFPTGEHDDAVDAFSQLMVRWQRPAMSRAMTLRMLRARAGIPVVRQPIL